MNKVAMFMLLVITMQTTTAPSQVGAEVQKTNTFDWCIMV